MFHKVVLQHMQGAVEFYYAFNCKFTKESFSKKFSKSVKICQNYGHESRLWGTLYKLLLTVVPRDKFL